LRDTNSNLTGRLLALALVGICGCSGGGGGGSGDAGADADVDADADTDSDADTDADTDTDSDADTDTDSDTDSDSDSDAGADAGAETSCPTTFVYTPSSAVGTVSVAGEWNAFSATDTPMTPTGTGSYTATVDLAPGLYGYKLVVDGATWLLDPTQGRRKYVSGTESSAVEVEDCSLPSLVVASSAAARPSASAGTFGASLTYVDGVAGSGPSPSGYVATLLFEGTETALAAPEISIDGTTGDVAVSLGGLADGKYRVTVRPAAADGRVGKELLLAFWIEGEAFSWDGALIYQIATDRFENGDDSNDNGITPSADPRGDWYGGDLQGITAEIESGTFDALGVRALWLTPFQTAPEDAYLAADGVHYVTGYDGSWPIKAREVDPRIGGEDALWAMVTAAHRHGIRVVQDFPINAVHEDHEYVSAHPDWFRTDCVCGDVGCDWTAQALSCMFASYLPDVDHTNTEATSQFAADAVWWLDTFDLDGLRFDAVGNVEEAATRNIAAEVRETFEPAGTEYFLTGSTAVGWVDGTVADNAAGYAAISARVGPSGLDGQLDSVLYDGVSYRTFASETRGMIHADYWLEANLSQWPAGAVMSPYLGSDDTARFATLADPDNASLANNTWTDAATAPIAATAYERTRVAMAWLLTVPGAPVIYYGDEHGQWGGAYPNNREMWTEATGLTADESATLAFVEKLGTARRDIPALRTGAYVSVYDTSEDTLVFGRSLGAGDVAVVGLTRAATAQNVTTDLGTSLGLANGTALTDRLGGPGVTVGAGGATTLSIPANGAVILTP
jgi:neopullulanase